MTVSFKARMIDNWHYFNYLVNRTIAGRCFFALLLILPLALPTAILYLSMLYLTVPGPNTENVMAKEFVPAVIGSYIASSFAIFLGLLLGSWIAPMTTIAIDAQFCHRKDLIRHKSSWRSFSVLAEEANYFYFMGWRNQYSIPKWAFDSRADAQLFFETALTYWREAKGIPAPSLPETAGTWPPAPVASNSAERGEHP